MGFGVLSEGAALEVDIHRKERPAFARPMRQLWGSTAKIDQIARDAGFIKADQVQTSNAGTTGSVADIDIISDRRMPEGFIAIRGERGAMVLGPNGKSFWVPFPDYN